jgi:hypothetical protein
MHIEIDRTVELLISACVVDQSGFDSYVPLRDSQLMETLTNSLRVQEVAACIQVWTQRARE